MLTLTTRTGLNLAIAALKVHKTCNAIVRASEKPVSMLLDSVLGFQLGGIAGWVVGWHLGSVYRHLFEPAAAMDFDEVRFWYELPQAAAHHGMLAGALTGMVVIHIYCQICLRKRGEV